MQMFNILMINSILYHDYKFVLLKFTTLPESVRILVFFVYKKLHPFFSIIYYIFTYETNF